jgi:two-component system sensor histidine kinase KdpD
VALEREAARSARGASERLGELDRLRERFVSSVSHNLRTPLTATRAGLGLLEESARGRLRPGERDLLENARRNTARLGMIVDDLLAYNQLEAGTLRLERESLDLRAVAGEAISSVDPLLREKGQTLEMDLPAALPVEGDPRLLEQVVVNLLENAHLHTPQGTRVILSGRTSGAGTSLTVSDDGPGIPKAETEAVFRRFHRLETEEGGSGIGLAITRSIVEMHDGRVWAENRPGGGASFVVVLPARSGAG